MDDHPSGTGDGPVDRTPPIGRLTRPTPPFPVYNALSWTFVVPMGTESDRNTPLLSSELRTD